MRPDKGIRLDGVFCSLIPITEKELPLVVELRNREKNKYFMNQAYDITLESQKKWYQDYQKRDDDVYWGIWNRENIFVGTIRLYHVKGEVCEEGSCIVDERYAGEAPYAVEAKYLLVCYAFQTLELRRMVNEIRTDNKVMNSLAKQQGFRLEKLVDIGGVQYNYMVLDSDRFAGDRIRRLLAYWKERDI